MKSKIFKKKSELDQDLEFKKINADRDVMTMLAKKAVDAMSRERSLKDFFLNLFPNHTW